MGADFPEMLPVRLVLAEGLLAIKALRPDLIPEYRGRLEPLNHRYPLPTAEQEVVEQMLAGSPAPACSRAARHLGCPDTYLRTVTARSTHRKRLCGQGRSRHAAANPISLDR